jgi:hypothetical protein
MKRIPSVVALGVEHNREGASANEIGGVRETSPERVADLAVHALLTVQLRVRRGDLTCRGIDPRWMESVNGLCLKAIDKTKVTTLEQVELVFPGRG